MHRHLMLFAAALTLLAIAPPREPSLQDPANRNPAAQDPTALVGSPFAAALARFGPPDGGGGRTGLVQWRWCDAEGGTLIVAVHAGMVVAVDASRCRGEIEPREVPATGHYPGQTIAELIERMGAPTRAFGVAVVTDTRPPGPPARSVAADAILVYGKLRLMISAGHVLGVEPPPPPVHGPR